MDAGRTPWRVAATVIGWAAMGLAPAGCASSQPSFVARHPWIEDPTTALVGEDLIIAVHRERVDVEARFAFAFREAPNDWVLTFPIPPPCSATDDFTASLEGDRQPSTRLVVSPSDEASSVPMGAIAQRFDIYLPGEAFAAHRGKLVVRYSQACDDRFEYTLLSGAYWHGPIGRLEVLITDPSRRIRAAAVEKHPAHHTSANALRWTFRDLEPRGGVSLSLRSTRQSPDSVDPASDPPEVTP